MSKNVETAKNCKIALWRSEPQFEAVQIRYVTAGIVGLNQSQAAMATLYGIGLACYPCFGPSGS